MVESRGLETFPRGRHSRSGRSGRQVHGGRKGAVVFLCKKNKGRGSRPHPFHSYVLLLAGATRFCGLGFPSVACARGGSARTGGNGFRLVKMGLQRRQSLRSKILHIVIFARRRFL